MEKIVSAEVMLLYQKNLSLLTMPRATYTQKSFHCHEGSSMRTEGKEEERNK
jgi:hypothetical protein